MSGWQREFVFKYVVIIISVRIQAQLLKTKVRFVSKTTSLKMYYEKPAFVSMGTNIRLKLWSFNGMFNGDIVYNTPECTLQCCPNIPNVIFSHKMSGKMPQARL